MWVQVGKGILSGRAHRHPGLGARVLPGMRGTKGDSIPKGTPASRNRMRGGEGCRSDGSPDGEHLEPPKPQGGCSC